MGKGLTLTFGICCVGGHSWSLCRFVPRKVVCCFQKISGTTRQRLGCGFNDFF